MKINLCFMLFMLMLNLGYPKIIRLSTKNLQVLRSKAIRLMNFNKPLYLDYVICNIAIDLCDLGSF